jgi:hypothetical protein
MLRTFCLLMSLSAFIAVAQDAPKPQFTARELFYSAAPDAPPAKGAPKAPKNAMSAKKAPVAPSQTAAVSAPPKAPQAGAVSTPPGAPQPTPPVALPGGGSLIKASAATAPAPATGTPLGLKYTILKKSGDEMVEVPPDTIFHSGDRIQFSVQTNGPGYLYIISQGSSGTWRPMFPSPDVDDGNNHVDGWSAAILPPKSRMLFDEQTGTEKFFIVFSRTPEESLEKMIYSLQGGNKVKPAAAKSEDKQPKQMVQIAMANIDDATVGSLRDAYTRDLIIEKVDDTTPAQKGQKKENATYVVNPSGSSDSRVVADLKLVHQ